MVYALKRVRTSVFLCAAVLAAGVFLPCSAARAVMAVDAVGPLTAESACGPAETMVGASNLLARVGMSGARTVRRGGAAKGPLPERKGARQAARSFAAPRSARKTPKAGQEQEPRAAVLRSFYTCDAMLPRNPAEGTGWRLVGPLRQS